MIWIPIDIKRRLNGKFGYPYIRLNETQRAVIASRIANIKLGDNQYSGSANLPTLISQPEAAEKMNVSERTIRNVRAVEKSAPELKMALLTVEFEAILINPGY